MGWFNSRGLAPPPPHPFPSLPSYVWSPPAFLAMQGFLLPSWHVFLPTRLGLRLWLSSAGNQMWWDRNMGRIKAPGFLLSLRKKPVLK